MTATVYRPFTDLSAINVPIPADAAVHPDSHLMISAGNYFLLGGTKFDAQKQWMGPGFRAAMPRPADTSTWPKAKVYANRNGWIGDGAYTIPMPSWMAAEIAPTCQKGDSNVCIADALTGDVWELWHATPPGQLPRDSHDTAGSPTVSTRWNASGVRHWPGLLKGLGYSVSPPSKSFQPGTSGSTIPLVTAMLVPSDFDDCWGPTDPGTAISHVMRISTFCGALKPTLGGHHPLYVGFAHSGDGRQPYGISAGGRIQLDPSIDLRPGKSWASLDALPLPWRWAARKIARGLQLHGAIQVDSFGSPGYGCIDAVTKQTAKYWNSTHDYKFPWDAAGYPWGKNGIGYDLMLRCRALAYTGV